MKLFHTVFCGQASLMRCEDAARAEALARKFAIERIAGRLASATPARAAELAAVLAAATKPSKECEVTEISADGPESRVIAFTPRTMEPECPP